MGQSNAAVALRCVQLASTTQLRQYNTHKLPEGSIAIVPAEGTYRLSYAVGLAAVSTLVYAGSGGGFWVKQSSPGLDAARGLVRLTGTAVVIPIGTQNTWEALPVSTFTDNMSDGFASSATTGIVTWSGPASFFLVTHQVSMLMGAAATALIETAFSKNGSRIAGTTSSFPLTSQQHLTNGAAGLKLTHTLTDIMQLGPGDTVQSIVRNVTDANGGTLEYYSLTITPAGI